MNTIGIDLHKRESQLRTITEDGELIEQRIATSPARFTAVLGGRPPARILLEAAPESEWVARHLETLGHRVIVADPGFAAMYATRSSRVKTDKRDARTLCEALRLGAYGPTHRASDAQRHLRAELAVRDALVRPPDPLRGSDQGVGLLVPGENQQPRSKTTDGMRGDTPWTNEGEGGTHLWVRGGKSRPIPWRPAREVGLVNAQVLEQLKNTFLDRQPCCSCHAFSSSSPIPHGRRGARAGFHQARTSPCLTTRKAQRLVSLREWSPFGVGRV